MSIISREGQDTQLAAQVSVERTVGWKDAVNGIERVHEALRRRQRAWRIEPLDSHDLALSSFQSGSKLMGREKRRKLGCVR